MAIIPQTTTAKVGPVILPPGASDPTRPTPSMPIAARANSASGFPLRKRSKPSGFVTVILKPSTNSQFPNTDTVSMEGDRFVVFTTNLPVKIQPQPAGRPEIYYQGNAGRFSDPFDKLIITNTSATAVLTCMLWIGYEDLANYVAPLVPATPFDVFTPIAATGVVQPMSATDQYFVSGYFYGYKAAPAGGNPNQNLNTAWIGKTAANQPDQLAAGLIVPYEAPRGQWFNLKNIYVVGTAGDGVFFNGS